MKNVEATRMSTWQRWSAGGLALVFSCTVAHRAWGMDPGSATALEKRLRQPVALVCADGGKTLLTGNRGSGTISVIDSASRQVVAEGAAGRGLSDLALLPDGARLLAVDRLAGELILLAFEQRSVRVIERRKVSPDPVRLVCSKDGSSCVVASTWSRRLTFVELLAGTGTADRSVLSVAGTLDVPFCPRELALIGDGSKVVAADAFGGRLAVIDARQRKVESIRLLPAHNIRGMTVAPDGRTLLIAHQALSRLAHTSFDDVHWGMLIRNHLRIVGIGALLSGSADSSLLDGSRLLDLGDVGSAAGDPSAIAFDKYGDLVIALAGVDEVAITSSPGQPLRKTAVGRRPTSMVPGPEGSLVYVANELDDTVSVVAIGSGRSLATISLGPRPELTAIERGERLFSSAGLSHDGWMSCQSCHTDGHTNNLLSDTLGDGSYGAPKRVPSLLGVGATGPWTWMGSIDRLEDQLRKSIVTTMQGRKPSDEQVADLAAYLRSLRVPAPSTADLDAHGPSVTRGQQLFQARKCADCHAPPEYTSSESYDVGLVDEVGNRRFNPPSLRGVSRRDALLHDGRAHSLAELFQKERHPAGLVLSAREVADLVAFLETL
jgi:YVTN family beta-propeller protein